MEEHNCFCINKREIIGSTYGGQLGWVNSMFVDLEYWGQIRRADLYLHFPSATYSCSFFIWPTDCAHKRAGVVSTLHRQLSLSIWHFLVPESVGLL